MSSKYYIHTPYSSSNQSFVKTTILYLLCVRACVCFVHNVVSVYRNNILSSISGSGVNHAVRILSVSVTHMYSVVVASPGMRKIVMVVFMLVNSLITGEEWGEGVVEQAEFTGAQCTTYPLTA